MITREQALAYHRDGRPGKLKVVPTKPTETQEDLALAYTPGVAEPCFAIDGRIAWAPAGLLAAGFALGGVLGAHAAVRGGERWIRPVLAASVIALAGRMLGFF